VLKDKFSSIQTGTYAHLISEAYKAFPTFQLIILGKQVTFMVVSGAISSVVKAGESLTPHKLSGNHVYSVPVSGQVVKEEITSPGFALSCTRTVQ